MVLFYQCVPPLSFYDQTCKQMYTLTDFFNVFEHVHTPLGNLPAIVLCHCYSLWYYQSAMATRSHIHPI